MGSFRPGAGNQHLHSTGFVSLLLAELGHTCKGVDLSENMLSKAKEKAEKAGFHDVTFAIGDAEDTKEPADQYDVVINRHLVWTLPHPEKAYSGAMESLAGVFPYLAFLLSVFSALRLAKFNNDTRQTLSLIHILPPGG